MKNKFLLLFGVFFLILSLNSNAIVYKEYYEGFTSIKSSVNTSANNKPVSFDYSYNLTRPDTGTSYLDIVTGNSNGSGIYYHHTSGGVNKFGAYLNHYFTTNFSLNSNSILSFKCQNFITGNTTLALMGSNKFQQYIRLTDTNNKHYDFPLNNNWDLKADNLLNTSAYCNNGQLCCNYIYNNYFSTCANGNQQNVKILLSDLNTYCGLDLFTKTFKTLSYLNYYYDGASSGLKQYYGRIDNLNLSKITTNDNLTLSYNIGILLPYYNISYNKKVCSNLTHAQVNLTAVDINGLDIYYALQYVQNNFLIYIEDFDTLSGFFDYKWKNSSNLYTPCAHNTFLGLLDKAYLRYSNDYNPFGAYLYINNGCQGVNGYGKSVFLHGFGRSDITSYWSDILIDVNSNVSIISYAEGGVSQLMNNITFKRLANGSIRVYNNATNVYTLTQNTDRIRVFVNNSYNASKYNFWVYDFTPQDQYTLKYSSAPITLNYDNIKSIVFNYNMTGGGYGIDNIDIYASGEVNNFIWLPYASYNNNYTITRKGEYNYNIYITNEYYKDLGVYNTSTVEFIVSDYCVNIAESLNPDTDELIDTPETLSEYWNNIVYIMRLPYRIFNDFSLLDTALVAIKFGVILGLIMLYYKLTMNGALNAANITIITGFISCGFLWVMKLLENNYFIFIAILALFYFAKDIYQVIQGQANG